MLRITLPGSGARISISIHKGHRAIGSLSGHCCAIPCWAMDAGIDPSVGTVRDSYDNALAESIIGLFKTEVTKLLGPWKSMGQLEWETLKWVDWYNTKRLHSAIGYITPHEADEMFYETLNANEKAA